MNIIGVVIAVVITLIAGGLIYYFLLIRPLSEKVLSPYVSEAENFCTLVNNMTSPDWTRISAMYDEAGQEGEYEEVRVFLTREHMAPFNIFAFVRFHHDGQCGFGTIQKTEQGDAVYQKETFCLTRAGLVGQFMEMFQLQWDS